MYNVISHFPAEQRDAAVRLRADCWQIVTGLGFFEMRGCVIVSRQTLKAIAATSPRFSSSLSLTESYVKLLSLQYV